jgi:hypothetical protein
MLRTGTQKAFRLQHYTIGRASGKYRHSFKKSHSSEASERSTVLAQGVSLHGQKERKDSQMGWSMGQIPGSPRNRWICPTGTPEPQGWQKGETHPPPLL